MRSRLTTLGMLLTLGIALGGLPAEGRAAQAMLSCPGMAQAGQPLTVEMTIAVGTTPTTTTTPATASSTTTASTAPLPGRTTTTTTPPCTSARCTLEAVQSNAACAGQTIPASVANKFSRAANLVDQAATSSAKRARSLLKKAKRTLKEAGAKAIRATKGKTPKLSSDCGAALKDAANGVLAGLGV